MSICCQILMLHQLWTNNLMVKRKILNRKRIIRINCINYYIPTYAMRFCILLVFYYKDNVVLNCIWFRFFSGRKTFVIFVTPF